MAEIEHSISGVEDAEVELDEDFGAGFFLALRGNGSAIRCYLDPAHLQLLCDRLCEWGYKPGVEPPDEP